MRVRPIVPAADGDGLRRLADREARPDGLTKLSESKALSLLNGSGQGFLIEERGEPVAFVSILDTANTGEWAIEVLTENPASHVGPLLEAVIDSAPAAGVDSIRWWVYGDHAAHVPAEFGFEPERRLLFMTRPLPAAERPRFEDSIELTAFRPGIDDVAWLEGNNSAFAGHPENGALTRADLDARMATEWFSADGFRMAWSGPRQNGNLAGFCWTKIHPTGEGEIYIIAVVPGHEGRGLGRQLVLEGMRHLAERGCRRVVLYTESDNERAVSLYRSLDFETEATHRSFKLDL
ncbi:MAG TPA: mycothiol synthase [Acidimicrobiia bacterium]|nr:mycothiol synthase [Acidimicrobiia bacterium]